MGTVYDLTYEVISELPLISEFTYLKFLTQVTSDTRSNRARGLQLRYLTGAVKKKKTEFRSV